MSEDPLREEIAKRMEQVRKDIPVEKKSNLATKSDRFNDDLGLGWDNVIFDTALFLVRNKPIKRTQHSGSSFCDKMIRIYQNG